MAKVKRVGEDWFDKILKGAKKTLDSAPGHKLIFGPSKRELKAYVRELQGQVIDILSAQSIVGLRNRGNIYADRTTAIAMIYQKYSGVADWGCQYAKRIINVRSAFVLPHGVECQYSSQVEAEKSQNKYKDELTFIKDLLDQNDLNEGFGQRLVKGSELEGQVLGGLEWNSTDKMVDLIYQKWYNKEYVVSASSNDPEKFSKARWLDKGKGTYVTLLAPNMVFVAFNAADNPFIGSPVIRDILTECENLDIAIKDWRRHNQLYARTFPHFKANTQQDADYLNTYIQGSGWKVGQAIVTNTELSFPGPSTSPGTLLGDEITTLVKVISGATGVNVQWLGFPDVLSNRAVAEEMSGPMEIVTWADITQWYGFFEDFFRKAVEIRNSHLHKELNPEVIKPRLLPITDRQFQRMTTFWLPAFKDKAIDLELFLQQIPGINPIEVLKRIQKNQEEEAKKAAATAAAATPFGLPILPEVPEGGEEEEEVEDQELKDLLGKAKE